MSELDFQNIIDGIFDQMVGVFVVHGNEEYSGDDDCWIRVTKKTSTGRRMSLGPNSKYRYYGVLFVQIFTKPDTGEGLAASAADQVVQLIRDKNIEGVQFYVPTVSGIGVDKGWYQTNVLTEFYRED